MSYATKLIELRCADRCKKIYDDPKVWTNVLPKLMNSTNDQTVSTGSSYILFGW